MLKKLEASKTALSTPTMEDQPKKKRNSQSICCTWDNIGVNSVSIGGIK